MEEILLGFDVREMWLAGADLWDEARRATFLLRDDVAKPLSTDPMVWPSLFDTDQGNLVLAREYERRGLLRVATPAWIGPNSGLWENLDQMRQYLAATWTAPPCPCAVVAISWFSHSLPAAPYGPYRGTTTPPERDPAWERLGFDVTDGSLLSGIANTGYRLDEAADWRARWGAALNRHHLFAEPEPALAFRAASDARVPEHAPFCVFGLYVIGYGQARAGHDVLETRPTDATGR
jgi:hypothetical protein